jgi:imidazolonepropionase-like amidohydrolase
MEYSFEEVKAAADEADRWNTYLAVHTYTDRASRQSIEAGAKTLEHANLMTEKTVKLAVKKGVYISPQTGFFLAPAPDSFTPAQKVRQKEAADGIDNLMKACKKHNAKVLFGNDLVASLESKKLQLEEFTHRTKWFSNAEILKQATSINGEALALSGPRNPYPGKIGVIEEGALADLLLINGDPIKDISILTKPGKHLDLIMKDGEIYKNTIK